MVMIYQQALLHHQSMIILHPQILGSPLKVMAILTLLTLHFVATQWPVINLMS